MTNARHLTHKLELSNKFDGARFVRTQYCIGRYVNGCRTGNYALEPQDSREHAERRLAELNAAAKARGQQ